MMKDQVETLKSTPYQQLSFISKVIAESLNRFDSSWDMTRAGAAMLGVASRGNIGMALYMLSQLDPQPNQIITDDHVVSKFPLGFVGDWDKTWDEFRKADPDQRRVFRV